MPKSKHPYKTISFCLLLLLYSIKLVAKVAKGKKVSNKKSLVLLGEMIKITKLIINDNSTFLNDACKFNGRLPIEKTIATKKNKTTTEKIDSAKFSKLFLK